jgi:hypothetical protein
VLPTSCANTRRDSGASSRSDDDKRRGDRRIRTSGFISWRSLIRAAGAHAISHCATLQCPKLESPRNHGQPIRLARAATGTEVARTRYPTSRKGIAVTFFVQASKGENVVITARLSAAIAVAKGRSLLDDGWQVFITDPDGTRYDASEFDRLLTRRAEARLEI